MGNSWLKTYNAASLVLWITLAAYFFSVYPDDPVRWTSALLLVQGLAFMEIIHVKAGWVKSSLFNTVIQYLSRMFISILLYMVYIPWGIFDKHWVKAGTVMIFVAWPMAEVVRYAYYLRGDRPLARWLRYSAFILLYPGGVLAESFIMAKALQFNFMNGQWPWFLIICLNVVLYIFFFPKLYGYLWHQRKNKLCHERLSAKSLPETDTEKAGSSVT